MENHLNATFAISATSKSAISKQRHSIPTIALHWATVVAIMLAATSALWRYWTTDETLRPLLMSVHKQAGLFVLIALVLRVALRVVMGITDHAGPMPAVMRWAANLAHLALYGLLLALPAIGLALCWASAMDVSLFGLFRLPAMVEDDPDLAATLSDLHIWAAWAMLLMVVMHVAAALWHHHIRRDGVLRAMLPAIAQRSSAHAGKASPKLPRQVAPIRARTVSSLRKPSDVDTAHGKARTEKIEAKKYGTS
jgi:cytochrome b561